MRISILAEKIGTIDATTIEQVKIPQNRIDRPHVKITRQDGKVLILWANDWGHGDFSAYVEIFKNDQHYRYPFDDFGDLTSIENYKLDTLEETLALVDSWARMTRPDREESIREIIRAVDYIQFTSWDYLPKNQFNVTDYVLVDTRSDYGRVLALYPDLKNLDAVLYEAYENRRKLDYGQSTATGSVSIGDLKQFVTDWRHAA